MSCLTNNPVTLPPSIFKEDGLDWRLLLHREAAVINPQALAAPFEGKRILITGAGGWIGSAIAKWLSHLHPEHLVLLDSAEHGLYEIHSDLAALPAASPHTAVPGDICDAALLHEIFSIHRPQIVFHAAAYKHVPLMEHHPLAALRTNALGTYTLAQAAQRCGSEQLILLSTDKAVNPSSIMGASKRVAELVLLALHGGSTHMKALRLGNVLGSRGSVVPFFKKQIAIGGPVTVTDPDVRRYFLSLRESVELLLSLAGQAYPSGIYIPEIGTPIRIVDLAHFLIEHLTQPSTRTIPVVFTGLRPGDKMTEDLISCREAVDLATSLPLRQIHHEQQPATAELLDNIDQLQQFVQQRNVHSALQIVQQLVPEYQPSTLIRHQLAHPVESL